MKKILDFLIVISFIFSLLFLSSEVYRYFYPYEYNYYYNLFINKIDETKISIKNKNEYYRDIDFLYVQNVDVMHPTNKQELINSLYTFINSGVEDFTFYCAKEYKDCTKEAKELIYDDENNVISKIYEFAHPYNDYNGISCGANSYTGQVTFHVDKKYTEEKIDLINKEVDKIYNKLVDPNDTDYNNIRKIHDYLANTIEYDKVKSDYIDGDSSVDSIYDSTSAYGALIEKKAICGGYTDAMFLFLEKMNIKSMRVSSKTHIWNAVYLDNKWYHLDVTWDDARYTSGRDFLRHDYFLIDTDTLLSLDKKSHSFYQDTYLELAQNTN